MTAVAGVLPEPEHDGVGPLRFVAEVPPPSRRSRAGVVTGVVLLAAGGVVALLLGPWWGAELAFLGVLFLGQSLPQPLVHRYVNGRGAVLTPDGHVVTARPNRLRPSRLQLARSVAAPDVRRVRLRFLNHVRLELTGAPDLDLPTASPADRRRTAAWVERHGGGVAGQS